MENLTGISVFIALIILGVIIVNFFIAYGLPIVARLLDKIIPDKKEG